MAPKRSRSNIRVVEEKLTAGKLPRCGKKAKVSPSPTTPDLPDEILDLGILLCIPAKALMRMKCVCKRWHHIISNPNPLFIQLQAQNTSSGIISSPDRSLDWTLLAEDSRSIGIHKPKYPKMKRIAASCKGLLCLENGATILIGNPFFINTPSWVQIPPPGKLDYGRGFPYPGFGWVNPNLKRPVQYPVFGLAVDVEESGIVYRLVLLNTTSIDIIVDGVFHIFSSVSKQWSLAKGRPMLPYSNRLFVSSGLPHPSVIFYGPAVYVDGSLYRKLAVGDALRFNMKDELCSLFQLPATAGGNSKHGQIGESGGKLSYAVITGSQLKMWFLNDSNWSITLSITIGDPLGSKLEPPECKMNRRSRRSRETESHVNKEVLMMPFEGGVSLSFSVDGFIHCYNTLTGEFQKLTERQKNDVWFPYKNSLVLPPGAGEETIQIRRLKQRC